MTDVTVQYTYVVAEAIGDWTDAAKAAQITALTAEVIGPLDVGTNATATSVFVEVIHDVNALATTSVPILMACT